MNAANDWLASIMEAADKNGWIVIGHDSRSPGYVTLEDGHGTRIEIASPYGLDTKRYVEQLIAVRPASVTPYKEGAS